MTSAYTPPLAEIRFVLGELCDLRGLGRLPGYEAATPDVIDAVLEEAGRFAANELAPLNQVGDRQGCRLENGVVRTPDGFAAAYRAFVAGGWPGLALPEAYGGQGLPHVVAAAVEEMVHGANFAFGLCPLLTRCAAEALAAHGDEGLRRLYLPRMVSGEWTGAMGLTEPQAGSDVGALRTRAVRGEDGRYRITGTKIFITFGEHDWTENIVHLVLARTPDAPGGTRGISLFLVPKFLANEDGTLGARNDLRCVSLEHKLGIHASPTCVMAFGDGGEGAVGYLVGEERGGMRLMFTMMNRARNAVGLEGLAIAERAYQASVAYARERVQGRRPGHDGASVPARIVEHPDVRRTLLTMRAQVGAMRALVYTTAAAQDRAAHHPDPEERRRAEGRVDLLTPVVKAWCTDVGCEVTSAAIQVHGGMGYIEETGVAQYHRDARITPIYEGTNGIQALDLVGRKLRLDDGRLPWDLFRELRPDLAALEKSGEAPMAASLGAALAALEEATTWLQRDHAGDPDAPAAGATPYLRLFGATVGGFLLARGALAAAAKGAAGDAAARMATARFYARQLLPPATALLPAITAGSGAIGGEL